MNITYTSLSVINESFKFRGIPPFSILIPIEYRVHMHLGTPGQNVKPQSRASTYNFRKPPTSKLLIPTLHPYLSLPF